MQKKIQNLRVLKVVTLSNRMSLILLFQIGLPSTHEWWMLLDQDMTVDRTTLEFQHLEVKGFLPIHLQQCLKTMFLLLWQQLQNRCRLLMLKILRVMRTRSIWCNFWDCMDNATCYVSTLNVKQQSNNWCNYLKSKWRQDGS